MLEELYLSFTEAEVEKCVKTLKKNKATGSDNIWNEYILTSKATLISGFFHSFKFAVNLFGVLPT
jgi:hypothetical protein